MQLTDRVVANVHFMRKGKPEWWDAAVVHLSADTLIGEIVHSYRDGYLSGREEHVDSLKNYSPRLTRITNKSFRAEYIYTFL